jgi:hypothetical protein
MKILEFNINVPEDRIVTLTLSEDVVPGEHFTVMAIEDVPEKYRIDRDAGVSEKYRIHVGEAGGQ